MNKHLIIFILCCCILAACTGINTKPVITIAKSRIALSTVRFDSTYKIQYVIVNSGKSILKIDTASSSCDCTVPKIAKKAINPGDSTTLIVQFNPVDTGNFDKKVVIKSNIDSSFTIVSFFGRVVAK